MKYNGLPCPVCGRIMTDDDDIVVCPECATPQHRECWMKTGHCINEDKHSSGYVWADPEAQPEAEQSESPAEGAGAPASVKICHVCGSENPPEALHCGNCGALFEGGQRDPSEPKNCPMCGRPNDGDALHCKYCGAPFLADGAYPQNPYLFGAGIDENEDIGGRKAGEIAYYVQTSAPRYLRKFKRFASGKKLSFNWAAFFFAPYWFFYRKLYKVGAIFLLIFAATSLALSGPANDYIDAANKFYTAMGNSSVTDEQANELADEFVQATAKTMPIIGGVSLALRLICALTADLFYYRKMQKDLAMIADEIDDENLKRLMLARRGGASPMLFAAGFFGYNCIISLLTYIADIIVDRF